MTRRIIGNCSDADKRLWTAQGKVPFRYYGSSSVGEVGDEPERNLTAKEQAAIMASAEMELHQQVGQEALSLYDFSLQTLHDAPVCRGCG